MINHVADTTLLTQSDNVKHATKEELQKYFPDSEFYNDSKKALQAAKKMAGKEDLILVTGSLFVVGNVLA